MTLITTLPKESYTPVYVGDVGSLFAPLILDDTDNTFDLTGATLSTRMSLGSTVKTWNSFYWTIDDAPGGKAHYNYQAGDIDTPGLWSVQTTVTRGGKPVHTDIRLLEIKIPI